VSVYIPTPEQRVVPLERIAAEAAQNVLLPVFHGSPVPPAKMGEYIEARQSLTKDYDGRMVPHGAPAVSTSTYPGPFPIVRSLLHANHPCLADRADIALTFGREANRRGIPYYFVGAVTLRVLMDNNGVGSVYACEGRGTTEPLSGREDLGERRASKALRWVLASQTNVNDLPDFLQIINATEQQTWNFLDTLPEHEDPRILADTLGVPLMSMSEWRSQNLS